MVRGIFDFVRGFPPMGTNLPHHCLARLFLWNLSVCIPYTTDVALVVYPEDAPTLVAICANNSYKYCLLGSQLALGTTPISSL